jgi:hypothetical protein
MWERHYPTRAVELGVNGWNVGAREAGEGVSCDRRDDTAPADFPDDIVAGVSDQEAAARESRYGLRTMELRRIRLLSVTAPAL